MAASIPALPPSSIAELAAGDKHIEKAARNLNRLSSDFSASFGVQRAEVPSCRILAAQGVSLKTHIESHISAAQWLLGVRLKEHLADLITALLMYRAFNAALATRAILETAAATVFLQAKLEGIMAVPSEKSLSTTLEELHRSIAGGRFNWFGGDADLLNNLELYRAGKDPELPADRRAPSILTMLRKLDQKVQKRFEAVTSEALPSLQGGVVRAIYAQLSDICHPATGTAILLLEASERDGWVRMKNSTGVRETRWFFWNLGLFVPPVADVAYEALAGLESLTHP